EGLPCRTSHHMASIRLALPGRPQPRCAKLHEAEHGANGPGQYSAPVHVEDDLLALDLALSIEQVEARHRQRLRRAEAGKRLYLYRHHDERVALIADARDHAGTTRYDGLREPDQTRHVVVDADEIGRRHGGLHARCGEVDVARKALPRRCKVVVAPCLDMGAGNDDG